MSKIITIEVCANGTLTRANARTLNRTLGTSFSGSTNAGDALIAAIAHAGVDNVRSVYAAALTGTDKARHTNEVKRSRTAQARRTERKLVDALAA